MGESERVLPHNLEAERAVLGSVLVDKSAWAIVASTLTRDDFFREAHRRIFDALSALIAEATPDFVTLTHELERRGDLAECGGPVYVGSIADGVPRSTNAAFYARIVHEQAQLRAVIAAMSHGVASAYEAQDRPAEIVERGIRSMIAAVDARGVGLIDADDAIASYINTLDDEAAMARTPTGFTDLDGMLVGGFRGGNLAIVAARPSVGKTSLALGMADHIARSSGLQVPFFSLEMGLSDIAARLVGIRAHVQTSRLEQKIATSAEYGRVSGAMGAPRTKLRIECASRTVAEIEAWCRRAREEAGQIAAVVVDYLQLLAPGRRRENAESEVSEISRDLKRLAKTLNVPVIALSQLSRAPEARRDKRPTLADLRGSGALEQDADIALLLFREDMHGTGEASGIAEVIVAKSRNGPTGVVRLAFLNQYAAFENLAVGN